MKKLLIILILSVLFLCAGFFLITGQKIAPKIKWGVNFSQKHSSLLGLNWKENYLSILDDLKAKNIKILTHWDLLQSEKDVFDFNDLDFQIEEAEKRNAGIILVLGMKTGRWPECHLPGWVKPLIKNEQQDEILKLIEKVVLRYKDFKSVFAWQVENEPLFSFGECPWKDKDFLLKEVALVKKLDDARSVIVTDTGEWSLWISAARIGDIIGTTLYRRLWYSPLKNYLTYPLPPEFYGRKADLIGKLFGKKVINVELQAEPWGPKLLYDLPVEDQLKSMNLEQLKSNIKFAEMTGLDEFYLWGAEWWYWMKTHEKNDVFWEEAKKLFLN